MSETAYMVIAQAVGILAMIINVSSYQCKSHHGIMTMQLISSTLYAVNLYMLSGFVTGMILNLMGIARAIVFSNKKFFHAEHKIWIAVFFAGAFTCYALCFLLAEEPLPVYRYFLELLPVIGTCCTTLGFYSKTPRSVRLFSLCSTPCWFTYHFVNRSIGGVLGEIFCFVSIVSALIRSARRKE